MQSFFKRGKTKVGKNLHQTCGVLPLWYTCAQPYYLCSMAAMDTRFSLFRPDQHVIAINTWANVVAMPGVCTAIFLQHAWLVDLRAIDKFALSKFLYFEKVQRLKSG